VRRVAVSAPDEPLRSIAFEVLGSPPLIERFTIWYAAETKPAVRRMWTVPDTVSDDFIQSYEKERRGGAPPAEALRRIKLDWLRSGGERSHPYYWAAFVLDGSGAGPISRVIPWLWITCLILLAASAAFLVWWRRGRFELW
jgi:hypothetical protein